MSFKEFTMAYIRNDRIDSWPYRVEFTKTNMATMHTSFPGMMAWLCNEVEKNSWRWTVLGVVEANSSRHSIAILFANDVDAIECKIRFG